MVLVTQNQYILASKVNHITMDEHISHNELRNRNGRTYHHVDKYYMITVIYTPEQSQSNNGNGNRGDEIRECTVTIRGAVNAHQVFQNLIQQIREQMPDQLYLDTALERMIAGTNLEILKNKDYRDDFEMKAQLEVPFVKPRTKKVRTARKTKRTSKKVLRGAKR